jgi:hypothetical protein
MPPGSGVVTPSGYAVLQRQNSVLVEITVSNIERGMSLEHFRVLEMVWMHDGIA